MSHESIGSFILRKEQEGWQLVLESAPLYLIVHPAGRKVTVVTRIDDDGTEFVFKTLPGNHLGVGPW